MRNWLSGQGPLSGPPRPERAGGPLFHGARVLLGLVLAIGITLTFPPVPRTDFEGYAVGQVAPETVIARFNFAVRVSEPELERQRTNAAALVPPTFDLRPAAADSAVAALTRFFDGVNEAASAAEPEPAVRALLAERGVPASPAQARVLLDATSRRVLRETALGATRELVPQGVHEELEPAYAGAERLRLREGDRDRTVEAEQTLSLSEFYDAAARRMPVTVATPDVQNLLRLVLIRHVRPSLTFDAVTTREERAQARSAVPLVKANVLAGEAVVRANEQIDAEDMERLDAYAEAHRAFGFATAGGWQVSGLFGSTLFHFLLLSVFGALLFFFRTPVYDNIRWVAVLALLGGAYFAVAGVVGGQELPVQLLPVAFVSLVVAVLWDGRMALIFAVLLAVMSGALRPFDDSTTVPALLTAGAAGALSVRVVRRRSQFWAFVLIIALAQALATLGVVLMEGRDLVEWFRTLGWTAVGATASSILAMGFLPVFEWWTGITTHQTLLEWADPTRPLLGRLAREAPGTYAHTIAVANLSEGAANAIGADGLLCRVGAFYHDVGKMLKPQYFIENQHGGRNPHDHLKPETSALLVREHVTEGYRLAREARVPDVILDFILEHHGTQEIGFFKARALEEAEPGTELDPEIFQYPGPKPRSRETAILMIADAVESTTRALQDPSAERIRDLVESLVSTRLQSGQLDEAPLTLGEITQVREVLIKSLQSTHHQRIDYPATKHLTDAPVSATATADEPR